MVQIKIKILLDSGYHWFWGSNAIDKQSFSFDVLEDTKISSLKEMVLDRLCKGGFDGAFSRFLKIEIFSSNCQGSSVPKDDQLISRFGFDNTNFVIVRCGPSDNVFAQIVETRHCQDFVTFPAILKQEQRNRIIAFRSSGSTDAISHKDYFDFVVQGGGMPRPSVSPVTTVRVLFDLVKNGDYVDALAQILSGKLKSGEEAFFTAVVDELISKTPKLASQIILRIAKYAPDIAAQLFSKIIQQSPGQATNVLEYSEVCVYLKAMLEKFFANNDELNILVGALKSVTKSCMSEIIELFDDDPERRERLLSKVSSLSSSVSCSLTMFSTGGSSSVLQGLPGQKTTSESPDNKMR